MPKPPSLIMQANQIQAPEASGFANRPLGERIGRDIKRQVERLVSFEDFYFHFQPGSHVAALHRHREHRFFARIDIERFFYSIARNRVQRALYDVGIFRARHYAKWSCVKNPYDEPRYALPYGFVQSPILATLVLRQTKVGAFLRGLRDVTPTVYMDDISLSSDSEAALIEAYDQLRAALDDSNFRANPDKLRPPNTHMDVFNCDLTNGRSEVRKERKDAFYAETPTAASSIAFTEYCTRVEEGNR